MMKNNISRNWFFWWGLFFPMPALAFGLGDYKVGAANFILLCIVLKKIVEKIRSKKLINRIYTLHFAFVISIVFTMCVTVLTMKNDWMVKAFGFEIKMIFFLFCFIFLFNNEELKKNKMFFFEGLFYASVINLIWGWAQMYFGYIQGININKVVFGELLGIDAGINWDQSVAHNIVYRISGLSWETASFAIIEIIGLILTKNYYLRVIIILTLLASTSKTAIILMAVLFVYWLYQKLKFIFYKEYIFLRKKEIFKITVMLALIIGVVSCFSDFAFDYFQRAIDLGLLVIESLTTNTNASANVHKMYYEKVVYILDNSSIYNCLFGYGMFTAGFPYTQNNLIAFNGVWSPETDVITILIGNGVIGFIIYYLILAKGFLKAEDYIDKKFILVQIIGGITYLYCQGWMIPLFMITLSNLGNNDKNPLKITNNCRGGI